MIPLNELRVGNLVVEKQEMLSFTRKLNAKDIYDVSRKMLSVSAIGAASLMSTKITVAFSTRNLESCCLIIREHLCFSISMA
jgi:hypothetical protein